MNTILLLIQGLFPIALTELQSIAGLPPTTVTLISGIEQAATTFLTLFKAGKGNTVTATSILAAITASLQILQTQTNLDPKALAIISALAKAIQAGIDANANLTEVDPTLLQPIAPIV